MIKFKELIDTNTLGGDKIKIDDVLNKSIILTGASVSNSKYKGKGSDYCTKLQFYYENDETKTPYIVFTGSQVIRDQIESIKGSLSHKDLAFEVLTEIQKVGNYYSLV